MRMSNDNSINIVEQIEEYLNSKTVGEIIATGTFKKDLSRIYGQPEGSYIPSDYCYNAYCKASQWDRNKVFFFERLDKRGLFKYLGKDFAYTGNVYDKNGNLYGYWKDGSFEFNQCNTVEILQNNEVNIMNEILLDEVKNEEDFFNDDFLDLGLKIKEAEVISEKQEINIETLFNRIKRGSIVLQPEYQRKFVWDKRKSSNLIESILLNIPIPPIFISEENGVYEVIDGQQRLTSIYNFIDNKFPDYKKNTYTEFKLSKLSCLSDLTGKRFIDLPKEYQDKIYDKGLSVIIIKESTNKDVKFEMFNRLNTNITKLNNQELRNCLYRGTYNDFIKEMAQYEPFKKLINRPDYETRMLNEELVLSFFTFLDTDYHQYKGGLKQMMNNNMIKNRNIEKKFLVDKEEKFKKSIDLIKMMFKDGEAFRVFSLDKKTNSYKFEKTKINQGLWLILMYWFSMYSKNQIVPYLDVLKEELLNLQIHDEVFMNSITGSGTNRPNEMLIKFNIWGDTVQKIIGLPQNEPRFFSYELKQQLFEQNPTCKLCNNRINSIDDADIDHIICYSNGGATIPENARLTHRYCNQKRGNRF